MHRIFNLPLVRPGVHNEDLQWHSNIQGNVSNAMNTLIILMTAKCLGAYQMPQVAFLYQYSFLCLYQKELLPSESKSRLTRVLLSSIFFMADSVVRGNLIVWKLSTFCGGGALHRQK